MHLIKILLLLSSLGLTGCASSHNPKDPLEPLNRGIYKLNDGLDRVILKPVAQAYSTVVPSPVQNGVHNFFSNLDDVVVTLNDLLQLKFSQAASDGGRFLINSTFGVLGLFNVADKLEKHHEDFGQTLGYWGVGNGPYLMLPLLGPSTLRDGAGSLMDAVPNPINQIKPTRARNQTMVSKAIKGRAELLEQEKVMDDAIIDRYSFIRDAYLQHRESDVYDGNPPRKKYDDDAEANNDSAPAEAAPTTQSASPSPENSLVPINTQIASNATPVKRLWLPSTR